LWVNKFPVLSLWCTGLNNIEKATEGGIIIGLADKVVTKKKEIRRWDYKVSVILF
jgi:hypothetical protein